MGVCRQGRYLCQESEVCRDQEVLKESGGLANFWVIEKNSHRITREICGTKIPNELGLYDLSGNVREWCWDWYGSYSNGSLKDPRGLESGSGRVLRGGAWIYGADYCRVADRGSHSPDFRPFFIGLRLARTVR